MGSAGAAIVRNPISLPTSVLGKGSGAELAILAFAAACFFAAAFSASTRAASIFAACFWAFKSAAALSASCLAFNLAAALSAFDGLIGVILGSVVMLLTGAATVGAGFGIATAGAITTGVGSFVSGDCASNSLSFASTCARAAAWAAESVARVVKGAHAISAQITKEIFEVCMAFYYDNSPPDAIAFAPDEYNFRQTNGSGHASSDRNKIP